MTTKTQLITYICTLCDQELRSDGSHVYHCSCGGFYIPREAIEQALFRQRQLEAKEEAK